MLPEHRNTLPAIHLGSKRALPNTHHHYRKEAFISLLFTVQLIKNLYFICKVTIRLGSIYVLLKAQSLFEALKCCSIYYLSPSQLSLNPFSGILLPLPRSCLGLLDLYDPLSDMMCPPVPAPILIHPKHLRGCPATCVIYIELKARVQKLFLRHPSKNTCRQHDSFSHISGRENPNKSLLNKQDMANLQPS